MLISGDKTRVFLFIAFRYDSVMATGDDDDSNDENENSVSNERLITINKTVAAAVTSTTTHLCKKGTGQRQRKEFKRMLTEVPAPKLAVFNASPYNSM